MYTYMVVLLYVPATFREVLDKKYTAVFGLYML